MGKTIIEETTDILKKLSPKNQSYFMTLVRVAEVAENGVRNETAIQSTTNFKTDCRIKNQTT